MPLKDVCSITGDFKGILPNCNKIKELSVFFHNINVSNELRKLVNCSCLEYNNKFVYFYVYFLAFTEDQVADTTLNMK